MFISENEEQTKSFARQLASGFNGGEIILLSGDLGAGKTAFTKGVAEALLVKNVVASPTFTILNVHSGQKLELYHFDMYRIEDESELYELGFDELIGNKSGVCCVEWFENVPALFVGHNVILVEITKIDEDKRKIEIKEKIF